MVNFTADDDHDGFRINRLRETFSLIPCHVHQKIKNMHDHEGLLTVTFCKEFTFAEADLCASAWSKVKEYAIELI